VSTSHRWKEEEAVLIEVMCDHSFVSYIIHNTCQVIVLAIHFLRFHSDLSSLQPVLHLCKLFSQSNGESVR
jgi:hypothetical protein